MSIVVKVEGVDKTNLIEPSLTVDNQANSERDVCRFRYKKYGSRTFEPAGGDEIGIWDGATQIFGGVITRIEREMEANRIEVFSVEACDYGVILDRKVVTETFEETTVNDIIDHIITNYTDDGFTQNNVSCAVEVNKIIFNGKPVSKCLDELAELVGYEWYVDAEKDIHFFAKGNEVAPFDLTDTNGKYVFNSLKIGYDWTAIVNSVIIEGGKFKGTGYQKHQIKILESDVWDERKEYPTTIEFAEEPRIYKNYGTDDEEELTVGLDNLDSLDDYDVLWNFNEKIIRFSEDTMPGLFDTITLFGYELVPIKLVSTDQDSIDDYGKNELYKVDKSLKTYQQAAEYAAAIMDAYKDKVLEGSFRTIESGLRAGQEINIQSTIRDINQDFYIKSVRFTMRTHDSFQYEVELMTQKTAGLIDFLQRQLMAKAKELELDENAVITKHAQKTEIMELSESIVKDIGSGVDEPIPDYIFGPYFPTDPWPTDKKRVFTYDSGVKFSA
jgi:hypothetical protein